MEPICISEKLLLVRNLCRDVDCGLAGPCTTSREHVNLQCEEEKLSRVRGRKSAGWHPLGGRGGVRGDAVEENGLSGGPVITYHWTGLHLPQ